MLIIQKLKKGFYTNYISYYDLGVYEAAQNMTWDGKM